jgi:hypothetical protein
VALAIWSLIHAQPIAPASGKTMTKATITEHRQEMKKHKQKLAENIKPGTLNYTR